MKMLSLTAVLLLGLASTSCATKDYVHEYVQGQLKPVQARLASLEQRSDRTDAGLKRTDAQVSALAGRLDQADATLKNHDERITAVSKTAQEALDRAIAAGKLAEGKLLYEVVMTHDTLRFPPDGVQLSAEARAALDEFAARLKAE
ncbi:MAG: hypothetical protein ACK4TK_01210, partial [Thiobacillaceae bacterium]